MFVEQYIDSLGQSRTTPSHSTIDDDYLLALELQKEFDQQAEERNASGERIREQGILFKMSFSVDSLDEDYALAMQLQMEEEQQYQAMHAREQKSSKCCVPFLILITSDR